MIMMSDGNNDDENDDGGGCAGGSDCGGGGGGGVIYDIIFLKLHVITYTFRQKHTNHKSIMQHGDYFFSGIFVG